MPRPAHGARLVWKDEQRKSNGDLRSKAQWFIYDGSTRRPTGFSKSELEAAEVALSQYIGANRVPVKTKHNDPDNYPVADAVNIYIGDVVYGMPSQPHRETLSRLDKITAFFGDRMVGEIDGDMVDAYVAQSPTMPAARRQLEDFRSALNYAVKRGYLTSAPAIPLPAKSLSRIRWLTRDEAALLIKTCLRMTQTWKGRPSSRYTHRHVARFIILGIYTGTRSGAIMNAALKPTPGRGYVDLKHGVFHRKAADTAETRKRQPPVRLPRRVVAHIDRWSRRPALLDKLTLQRGKSAVIGRKIAEDHVIEWEGGPVKSIRKAFASAVEAAGLGWRDEAGKFQTDVTPHVLRHTAATWLMQNGTSLSNAADYLGVSEEVLRSHYYHMHPDFQEEAAENVTRKPKR